MAHDAHGPSIGPSVAEVLASHAGGTGSPTKTATRVADAIAARGDDGTWLSTVPREELLAAAAEHREPARAQGPCRSTACRSGSRTASTSRACRRRCRAPTTPTSRSATAPAVQRLLDAGALYVGKTNLDQFATGLNGTRTPYTVPRSVYGGEMISGGSSSGSALAVALGQVPFAVATDTAGSGRVPAALNGVVGYKPSRGLISTVGLVPACKSLDCISVMAGSIDDVDRVMDVMIGRDDADAWSRDRGPRYAGGAIRVGLPPVERARVLRRRRDAHRAPRLPRPPRQARHRRRRLARAVPRRGRPALPGSLGGRTARRVRRLPRRAARLDPPRGARHPPQRREVHAPSTPSPRCSGCRSSRPRSGGCGRASTCSSCRPSAPPSPSTRCWPGPSTATPSSATTRTSATCSTCSASPFRWAPPPTGGPTAQCFSAPHSATTRCCTSPPRSSTNPARDHRRRRADPSPPQPKEQT